MYELLRRPFGPQRTGPVRLREYPHPATVSLHPAVYFFQVSHPHHEDEEDLVSNLIDDAAALPRLDIDIDEVATSAR